MSRTNRGLYDIVNPEAGYGCGVGRLHNVIESGVVPDKKDMRSDPARIGTRFLGTRPLSHKGPGKGLVVYDQDVLELEETSGVVVSGYVPHGVPTPFTSSPEQVLEDMEASASEEMKLSLLEIATVATPDSDNGTKLAYALLTYYLSDSKGHQKVIDVLASDNSLEVLAEKISTATYTPKFAALIAKNAFMVEEVFGHNLAGKIFDSVAKQYPSANFIKEQEVNVQDFCSYYLGN